MKFKPELPKTSGWYFARFKGWIYGIVFYCSQQRAVYEAGFAKYHDKDFEGEWGDRIEMPVQAE